MTPRKYAIGTSDCEHANDADVLYLVDGLFVCITCVADKAARLEQDIKAEEDHVRTLKGERQAVDSLVGYNPGGDARLDTAMNGARSRLRQATP